MRFYRLLALLVALGISHAYSQNNYDIIISDGRVVDGSGNPWYEADVAINGERIVRIGDLSSDTGSQVIDANGLIVAPGLSTPTPMLCVEFWMCPTLRAPCCRE